MEVAAAQHEALKPRTTANSSRIMEVGIGSGPPGRHSDDRRHSGWQGFERNTDDTTTSHSGRFGRSDIRRSDAGSLRRDDPVGAGRPGRAGGFDVLTG
jgi:hypothetical protein